MVLVVVNVAMVVVATEIDLTLPSSQYLLVFVDAFELFSFVIFALEYVLRMWVCILDEKYAREGVVMGRLQYFISYNSIIDLMALIPTIVEFATNNNRGLSGTDPSPNRVTINSFKKIRKDAKNVSHHQMAHEKP
jgi:voltage-gated potassium channel